MKISKFLKRKRNIWIIAILIVLILAGALIFSRKNNLKSAQMGSVAKQNLQQTVLATGQIISGTDLELAFQSSGRVSWVRVKEGDRVYAGQALATLDQSAAKAQLTQAEGSLAQQRANLEKIMQGTTPENIKVYEDSVSSAQHDLDSSYESAVNTLNDAYIRIYNAHNTTGTIQNNYFSSNDQEGFRVSNAKANMSQNMQAFKTALDLDIDSAVAKALLILARIYNDLDIIRAQCDSGIYYLKVSSADKTSLDTQKTNINTAITSVTKDQQSIASDKIALQKARHQMDVQKAPPTQADINVAKAQILSAEGQVESAKVTLNNTVLVAPSAGTITEVDVKTGEQATALAKAIVLQNVSDLHSEADVSEANIASLKTDQSIDYTFDALGPDKHYAGKILTINPASTVVSGVVNYLVKGSLENVPEIKPGMTANMTIMVAKKDNVLAVPSTAIINKNNKKYVKVIDDEKKLKYHEKEVQTGLEADGGLVEIISGLSEGQKIIIYMK